ncbi:MAG: lipoprotein signal peptidase [Bacteroidia bacterium]
MKKALSVIFSVLLLDQFIKIYIKTHFLLGDEVHVFGNWFIIHFTENNGMAFGMEFAGSYGKIFLSTFRIFAVLGIGWYLLKLIREKAHNGLIISFALIFAGALGNILDSAFYGIIFSDSNYQMAQLFPKGGGYAPFLHGKVVDMFYFPIMEGHFPTWFPLWKTEEFIFFRPVFNTADASITVGVFMILFFQKRFYPTKASESLA